MVFEGEEGGAVEVVVLELGGAEVDQQGGLGAAGQEVVQDLGVFGFSDGADGLEFDDASAVPAEEVGAVARREGWPS